MLIKEVIDLVFPPPLLCPLCQKREIREGLPICGCCVDQLQLCLRTLKIKQYHGYVLCIYQGAVKQLLHRIKYNNDYKAAEITGVILGLAARELNCLQNVDYLVPVPLHSNRLKQRGFNQTEVFALGMNRVWQCPVLPAIRRKDTLPQSGLLKKERINNMHNAFYIDRPHDLKDKHLLILDDIFTTGATFCSLANLIDKFAGIPYGLFFAESK